MTTEADIDALTRTLLGEAADQGTRGMAAVAHVVLNRLNSGQWGNSIYSVVHSPLQFSAWNKGEGGNDLVNTPVGSGDYRRARRVAEAAINGQTTDPTGGALYYWAPRGMKGGKDPKWASSVGGERLRIGGHIFLSRDGGGALGYAGSKGSDAVREVQRQLGAAGYNIAIDGIKGPKTTAAIKDFQRANGLLADGIAGPQTRVILAASGMVPLPAPTPLTPPMMGEGVGLGPDRMGLEMLRSGARDAIASAQPVTRQDGEDLLSFLQRRSDAILGASGPAAQSVTSTLGWKDGAPDAASSTIRQVIPSSDYQAARDAANAGTIMDPAMSAMIQPKRDLLDVVRDRAAAVANGALPASGVTKTVGQAGNEALPAGVVPKSAQADMDAADAALKAKPDLLDTVRQRAAAVANGALPGSFAQHVATAPGSSNVQDVSVQSPEDRLIDMGQAFAGGAAPKTVAPVPMPGRPASLTATAVPVEAPVPMPGRPAGIDAEAPSQPADSSQAVTTAPPLLRLPSGKLIAAGNYRANDGQHFVTVTDDGAGNAVVTKQLNVGEIPGVIDPLREANSSTVAGGVIRSMIPKAIDQGLSSLAEAAPAAVDNVKSAAASAAANLGNVASGMGLSSAASTIGNAFGSLGSIFGAKPAAPAKNSSGSPDDRDMRTQPTMIYTPTSSGPSSAAMDKLQSIHDVREGGTTVSPKAVTVAPAFKTVEMTITNPAYTKYLADHKADDIGEGPGSFDDLQAMLPKQTTVPTKAPPPPKTITVTKQVPIAPKVTPKAVVVAPTPASMPAAPAVDLLQVAVRQAQAAGQTYDRSRDPSFNPNGGSYGGSLAGF